VFSGRPGNELLTQFSGGKIGILNADGPGWAEQRRFTLRTLRDFGFGKKNMEAMIMDEVTEIIEIFKKESGKPFSVNRRFSLAVLNALWAIMTSERNSQEDPKLKNILDTAIETFREIGDNPIALFFPNLAKKFPGISGWNKLMKALGPLNNIFHETVKERVKNPGDEDHPRDLMDAYMNEVNKTTDPYSTFYKETGVNSMRAVIADLHGAGSETTSTTLTYAILYLMKHPEIQKKLHDEIDRVVGKSRVPCLADKPNMPYTEAVMLEVLRYSTITPLSLFHSAMEDTTFHGYFIPKGTQIIGNLHASHFNPMTWGDPENFRPERFLSTDGKIVVKNEALIPFSTGKRVCIGESLARDSFFLFLSGIFQRFQVNPDPDHPVSIVADPGIFPTASPFMTIMTDRLE